VWLHFLSIKTFVSLWPIIARRVSERVPSSIKTTRCDRLVQLFRCLQFGACVLVPETEASVGADRGQSAVGRVKRNTVDSIDILRTPSRPVRSVTLECKVIFRILWVDVLNGYSSLYATESKTNRRRIFALALRSTNILTHRCWYLRGDSIRLNSCGWLSSW